MSQDNKHSEEQITGAGAVELEEHALDHAAGGSTPSASAVTQKVTPENKYAPAQGTPGAEQASGDFHIKFQGPSKIY